MITQYRLHLAVAAYWAAVGFVFGWLTRNGERGEIAVTAATIAAAAPVFVWQLLRAVRRYRLRPAAAAPGDAGRSELARDRLQTVATIVACFGLFAVAVFAWLLGLERRSTVLFVAWEVAILLLVAWVIHTSLLQDRAEGKMDAQDALEEREVTRAEAAQVGRDSRLAAAVRASSGKLDEIAETTRSTHAMTNSVHGATLLAVVTALRAVEQLTTEPEARVQAQAAVTEAQKRYDEHMAGQAVVDAAAGPGAPRRGPAPPRKEGV